MRVVKFKQHLIFICVCHFEYFSIVAKCPHQLELNIGSVQLQIRIFNLPSKAYHFGWHIVKVYQIVRLLLLFYQLLNTKIKPNLQWLPWFDTCLFLSLVFGCAKLVILYFLHPKPTLSLRIIGNREAHFLLFTQVDLLRNNFMQGWHLDIGLGRSGLDF